MSNENNKIEFSAFEGLVTATTSNNSGTKYTQDDIATYLANPYKNAQKLRQVSDWFYSNSGIYKNIINSFANLPTLDSMVIPTTLTLDKVDDKAYKMYIGKLSQYTDSIDIKNTTRRILKSVARYGAFVGYDRTDGKDFYIQSLPLDYCRVKYRIGNLYQMEFNFKYFDKFWDKETVDFAWAIYPKEFKSLYNKYKSDKKSKNPEWQMIDIKSTVCILSEEDDIGFIPMYSGMFSSLLNNEDYKRLIKTGQELETQKLIVQKVPIDNAGNLQIPKDQVKMFHNELVKTLPNGAKATTTPMAIESVPFSNLGREKEELLTKSEREVFVNAGTSSAVFADNGGAVALNINIETITANIYAILEKVEMMFTKKFLNVVTSKNYVFKLKYFRTTNINIQENFDRAFQMLGIGGAILPLFSLLGFDTETYTTMLTIEQKLGIKDLLIVPQSMHTTSGTDSGRPTTTVNKTTDSKDATVNKDTNNPKNKA